VDKISYQPPIISALPELTVLEDDSLEINICDWYDSVEDADTPDSLLTWRLYSRNNWLHIQTDLWSHSFIIHTDPDWWGTDTLTVVVSDEERRDSTQLVVHVLSVNDPPVFISDLADTSFTEDDTLLVPYSAWYKYVEDPDHPDTALTWLSFGSGHVSMEHDSISICFRAPENWHGQDTVHILVADGFLCDTTTFSLTVTPMNDAPQDFSLLSPGNDTTIVITSETITDTLMLWWEQARDVEGDSVWYGCVIMGDLALVLPGETSLAVDRLLYRYQAFLDSAIVLGDSMFIGTWTIFATDGIDTTWAMGGPFAISIKVSNQLLARLVSELLPSEFALHQNYPNPFNPSTTIEFDLPVLSDVCIVVYDLLGREVVLLVNQRMEPGYQHLVWDGCDRSGRELPSGIYIVLMQTPEYHKSIKLVMLK
jgi:hypothetical protein